MLKEKTCLVGHDIEGRTVIAIILAVLIVMAIIMIIVCGGAIIGGIYSLGNYFVAFKHNVIDDNVKHTQAA